MMKYNPKINMGRGSVWYGGLFKSFVVHLAPQEEHWELDKRISNAIGL
jgi:hypothetical protein